MSFTSILPVERVYFNIDGDNFILMSGVFESLDNKFTLIEYYF